MAEPQRQKQGGDWDQGSPGIPGSMGGRRTERARERKTGSKLCSSRNGSKRWEEKDTGLGAEKRTGRKPVPKLSSGQVPKTVKCDESKERGDEGPGLPAIREPFGAERLMEDLFFEARLAKIGDEENAESQQGMNLA